MSAGASPPAASRAGRRGRFDPGLVAVCAGYALRACFPTRRRIGLALPVMARTAGVRLWEVRPLDESLEALFRELVR